MLHQPKKFICFNKTVVSGSLYNVTNKNQDNSLKFVNLTENNNVNEFPNEMASAFTKNKNQITLVANVENDNTINNNKRKINIHEHHRSGSLTDSEESESSLSCDSLNCPEYVRQTSWNTAPSKLTFLPDSLLRDIRNRKLHTDNINKDINSNCCLHSNKKNETNDMHNNIDNRSCFLIKHKKDDDTKLSHIYENDRYYTFHINENTFQNVADVEQKLVKDESFAGYADIDSGNFTIRSNKGTVRGVKNRVRNGIATFLQMEVSNVKTYKEKDLGKVIIYTTSMGIVRNTYSKCMNMKQILRTLLVKFEERDVFMSTEYQQEIKARMQSQKIDVPQLFVEGQHIGDSDTIERLNEVGELRKMLQPYKCFSVPFTCQTCGGFRLLPCPSCNGSKKSIHRNHFTAEFIALKCMNCDEVGLVKCHNC